jgi:hypothetical protein
MSALNGSHALQKTAATTASSTSEATIANHMLLPV